MQTRGLEAFSRKVTTTASHLMNPNSELPSANQNYHNAMSAVTKQLQRPTMQRRVFSMARTTPTDMVRSKLSTREIQQRALSSVPDDMLANIPVIDNSYSLFQGFQATFPEMTEEGRRHHRRKSSRGRKLLEDGSGSAGAGGRDTGKGQVAKLSREKSAMMHELEMLEIRKNMASCEIRDIDTKIANLTGIRRTVMEKLAGLEQEEALLEHDSRFALSGWIPCTNLMGLKLWMSRRGWTRRKCWLTPTRNLTVSKHQLQRTMALLSSPKTVSCPSPSTRNFHPRRMPRPSHEGQRPFDGNPCPSFTSISMQGLVFVRFVPIQRLSLHLILMRRLEP